MPFLKLGKKLGVAGFSGLMVLCTFLGLAFIRTTLFVKDLMHVFVFCSRPMHGSVLLILSASFYECPQEDKSLLVCGLGRLWLIVCSCPFKPIAKANFTRTQIFLYLCCNTVFVFCCLKNSCTKLVVEIIA